MNSKEKFIKFIEKLPEKEIEKLMTDIVKPDKTKEMSDFLFNMINGSVIQFTGDREITYYKDNEWIIQQDYKNERLWVRYSLIWNVFEEKFNLNYNQIRNFIKDWIETNTKWKGLTPLTRKSILLFG